MVRLTEGDTFIFEDLSHSLSNDASDSVYVLFTLRINSSKFKQARLSSSRTPKQTVEVNDEDELGEETSIINEETICL